jgi:N-acetylmuramoyl-L-alanine amidase
MFKKASILLCIMLQILFLNCISNAMEQIYYDGSYHDYKAREVTLMLNGDKFVPSSEQMPPIILNNRTLVPVREVFEYLDGKVEWYNEDRRVEITFDDNSITLWINKEEAIVNGKPVTLDVPAKIVNNKTMVPVRFISESAGFTVGWDAETFTVDIKFPRSSITKIGFGNVNGTNCLIVYAENKISGYKYFSLPKDDTNPLRLVLDIENCKFNFDTKPAYFDSGAISGIRFGDQGNDVNRIVLDFREDTDYVVAMSEDRKTLYYAMAEEFTAPSSKTEPEKTPVPTQAPIEDTSKNSGELIPEVSPSGDKEITTIDSGDTISNSGEKTSGDIAKIDDDAKPTSGDTNKESEIIDVQTSGENIILDDGTVFDGSASDEDSSVEDVIDTFITSVKYSSSSKRVKIKYKGDEILYSDSILTNPNRVVIDIENAELETSGPAQIDIKNSLISNVRFSQYSKTTVRVVLDLSAKGNYRIYKKNSELQVAVEEVTYKNIKYKKNNSNAQITLQGVELANIRYEKDDKKNTFSLTCKGANFGEGKLEINDDFMEYIETDGTQMIANDKGGLKYTLRQSSTNVIITIRKADETTKKEENNEEPIVETPKEDKEEKTTVNRTGKKVILIDVGHGGKDPGACNGDEQEKVYNLNIALYLYDMLKSRDDIIVYIDREDNDTYLNREDRVAYATKIDPDFIISVHNNSIAKKEYAGTMVLYFNNDSESDYGDITSSECAEIILKELINKLGTVNRGIVNRGDLHILSKTPCPSVLCEVCFISNDDELERLKTKTFQKSAAEAMYNGIVKILKVL